MILKILLGQEIREDVVWQAVMDLALIMRRTTATVVCASRLAWILKHATMTPTQIRLRVVNMKLVQAAQNLAPATSTRQLP